MCHIPVIVIGSQPLPYEFILTAFGLCRDRDPFFFWRPGYVHLVFFPLSILLTTGGLLNLWLAYQSSNA